MILYSGGRTVNRPIYPAQGRGCSLFGRQRNRQGRLKSFFPVSSLSHSCILCTTKRRSRQTSRFLPACTDTPPDICVYSQISACTDTHPDICVYRHPDICVYRLHTDICPAICMWRHMSRYLRPQTHVQMYRHMHGISWLELIYLPVPSLLYYAIDQQIFDD